MARAASSSARGTLGESAVSASATIAERVVGDGQDERAVGTARIGHGDRSQDFQDRAQPDEFVLHHAPRSPAEAIGGLIIAQPRDTSQLPDADIFLLVIAGFLE